MIHYKKLFEKLKKDHTELSSIVSKSVEDKIKSGGNIRLGKIIKICCKYLDCMPDDVISFK